ncbi:MAG: helix-turn-helix domain-containing protein [Acidobacteriota bacterium]|nr:helix-turn-helix domain-containing protein [Acidobacteriota bacterium]
MDIRAMKRSGKSIRAIAKELGLHRSTVKKHLERVDFPQYRKNKRKDSVLAPYEQTIRDFLEVDSYQATWILDKLKARGYAGGYDTVKRFVRTIKAQKSRLAYVRFETEPGKQAQFDWGDFQVEEPGGRTSRVFVFMLSFLGLRSII